MILFPTEHCLLYNRILHGFLALEVFSDENDEEDIGDLIEEIFPKYLYREQFVKCRKVLEELYDWTADTFHHTVTAFHERALFDFLRHMMRIQEDDLEFKEIYYDEKSHEWIQLAAQEDYEEMKEELADDPDFTLESCVEKFYEIDSYLDDLFEEWDFLEIDKLYNARKCGYLDIEKMLGINVDYYFELLPLDIQKQYETKHLTLMGEVEAFLQYLENRLHHGDLYRLF